MTAARSYTLACIATAIALACLIKWPALFLTVGAIILALAICTATAGAFFAFIIWAVMGAGAAR